MTSILETQIFLIWDRKKFMHCYGKRFLTASILEIIQNKYIFLARCLCFFE